MIAMIDVGYQRFVLYLELLQGGFQRDAEIPCHIYAI
jgi:hypothetical protein